MVVGFGTSSDITGKNRQDSQLVCATDCEQIHQGLADNLKDLQDPRGKQGVLHPFISIVMIALLATIGGATGWEDIETYGVSHHSWLTSFLQLPFGIPSADTYRRLFERISPKEFERSFNSWLNSLVIDLGAQVIPIDGKTLKGSYDRNQEQSALHVVSAWASSHRLFLGQVKVDDKSNEITAIPALLELLDISGCIITIDAMGTQHEIARRLHKKGADYILALKTNHPTLFQDVKQWFENAAVNNFDGIEFSYDVRVESAHHRKEKRLWAVSIEQMGGLYKQSHWSGLQTIVKVVRTRHLWNKTTQEVMFYLSSLPADAQKIGLAIRQHWSIENQLHWVIEVTFNEDACRIRRHNSPNRVTYLKLGNLGQKGRHTCTKAEIIDNNPAAKDRT